MLDLMFGSLLSRNLARYKQINIDLKSCNWGILGINHFTYFQSGSASHLS